MKNWLILYRKNLIPLLVRFVIWLYLVILVAWLIESWIAQEITVFFSGNTLLCLFIAGIISAVHTYVEASRLREL